MTSVGRSSFLLFVESSQGKNENDVFPCWRHSFCVECYCLLGAQGSIFLMFRCCWTWAVIRIPKVSTSTTLRDRAMFSCTWTNSRLTSGLSSSQTPAGYTFGQHCGNHLYHHLFLNRGGRWGTTDDFTTSFLHFSLFSISLLKLANSTPVHT